MEWFKRLSQKQVKASNAFWGDCRDESLVESIFGSVSEFARLTEEKGDNFTYGKYLVKYDPKTDIHSFWMIQQTPKTQDPASLEKAVEQKAFAAGYTVKADHGTNKNFRVMKPAFGNALWFSTDQSKIQGGTSGASGTTKILTVYLRMSKTAGWKEYDNLTEGQLISQGFDSVKLDDDYIVFHPEQVKLADPITYSKGKPIPLEQRFNPTSKDIRF